MAEETISLQITKSEGVDGKGNYSSTVINVDSLGQLARMLALAGITPPAEAPALPGVAVDSNGVISMEAADHDYGDNTSSRKGHEYEISSYDFQGRAGAPVRVVNNYGDNAMKNSDVHENARGIRDYLKEVEEKKAIK